MAIKHIKMKNWLTTANVKKRKKKKKKIVKPKIVLEPLETSDKHHLLLDKEVA